MKYELSQHAAIRLSERMIRMEWVGRPLFAPNLVELDAGALPPWRQPIESGDTALRSQHERKTMKLTVDPEADALYLRLNDAQIIDSEMVAQGRGAGL